MLKQGLRKQRFGPSLLSIGGVLFLAMTLLIVLISGLLLSLTYWSAWSQYHRQSDQILNSALNQVDSELWRIFGPVNQSLSLGRDWILSGQITQSALENAIVPGREAEQLGALNRLFIPVLQAAPQFQSVRILTEAGGEYMLSRVPHGWRTLTRSSDEAGGERSWQSWDENGFLLQSSEEALQASGEDSAQAPQDPRAAAWFLGAVAKHQEDLKSNREGKPLVYYDSPRMLEKEAGPVLTVGVAVETLREEVVAIGFDLRLNAVQSVVHRLHHRNAGEVMILGEDQALWAAPVSAERNLNQQDHDLLGQIEDLEHPVFSQAYARWQVDPTLKHQVFTIQEGEEHWWCAFRPFSMGNKTRLDIGVVLSGRRFARDMRLFATLVIAVLLIGLLASWFLAQVLAQLLRKPIDAFVNRVRRIDALETPQSYWPRSYLREMQALTRACDDIVSLASEKILELSLPSADPVEQGGAENGQVQNALIALVRREGEELPEIKGNKDQEEEPPRALLQALQTSRRQLKASQDELKIALEEVRQQGRREEENLQRLSAQRNVLLQLNQEALSPATSTAKALQAISEALSQVLGLSRISIWRLQEADRFVCLECFEQADQKHREGMELRRANSPMLFSALESASFLRVPNATKDPRTSSFFEAESKTSAVAMLVAPIHAAKKLQAMISCEVWEEERRWKKDEETFLLSVGQLVAHRFTLEVWRHEAHKKTPPAPSPLKQEAPGGLYSQHYLDQAPGAILRLSPEGLIRYANPQAAALYGVSPETMLGKELPSFSNSVFEEDDRRALQEVCTEKKKLDYRTEHLLADGSIVTLKLGLAPLIDAEGILTEILAIATDITSFAATLREAQASEAHFRSLVEQSRELIWASDSIGCITYVNPAIERFYGYQPEEVIGKPFSFLAENGENSADLERLSSLLEGQACVGYRATHRRKDGARITVQVYADVLRDASGRPMGAVGVAVL